MLYDNMIYFACCVASHGAQYGLFTNVIDRLLLLFFTRVVIIKYVLHAAFVLLQFYFTISSIYLIVVIKQETVQAI